MQPLTTIFTAPSWCLDSQYTDRLQTLSPGVCPDYMTIAKTASHIGGGKTIWMGGCCQSGFSDMLGYFCTSTVTTPMGFLLLPNITTADIYTTLSDMWIEHDQITVAWQKTDLKLLPEEVATRYASIMGIAFTATTAESPTATQTTPAIERTSSTIATSTTSAAALTTSYPTTNTTATEPRITPNAEIKHSAPPFTSSNMSSQLSPSTLILLSTWLACLWVSH
ncbi:hypothetical protein F5Y13DRAFT_167195 [Hypoxylon sp. FL1857]|nr:hypothetical protein F5Y13DRAFT_167195 [Hypoxylon sp. FL1857]